MANEAQPCACELGDLFDYNGLGEEVQIDHIKAYVCKSKTPSDKAVIVIQDIFGWELPNTRLFVDLLASNGYNGTVPGSHGDMDLKYLYHGQNNFGPFDREYLKLYSAVLPDFFVGKEPWKSTNDESTLFQWLETRPPYKVDKEVDAVLKYLKEECQAKKIGIIGFCWGGIVTHYLMLKYPELKAGVAFYGLVREDVDKYNLLNPTLFIFGENDHLIPVDKVELLEQKFKENCKVDYKVKVFPKQSHGFAHRQKEDTNPEDKPYIEEARKDMLLWLNKYIK